MSCSLTFPTFANSQLRQEQHEEGEPKQCVGVPPPGVTHLARAAEHVLCPVPGHVPDHGAGESAYHPAHQAGSSPPHPHVLLPQPHVLGGFLLLHSHYTQTIRKLGCRGQNYFLHWMHHAVLLCLFVVTETFMFAVMAYDRFVAV